MKITNTNESPKGWSILVALVCIIISLITCGMLIYDRQFNFGYGNSLLFIFSFGFCILLFSFSTVFSLTYIINFSKLSQKGITPVVLIVINFFVILLFLVLPKRDFYKTYKKDLGNLAQYVEEQVIDRNYEDKIFINAYGESIMSLPEQYKKTFERWPVDVYIEKKVLKIRLKLSGSSFGGNIFLLYRSDNKTPTSEDMPFKEEHPWFIKKEKHWFIVDYND